VLEHGASTISTSPFLVADGIAVAIEDMAFAGTGLARFGFDDEPLELS
jgi:hypothetical protein